MEVTWTILLKNGAVFWSSSRGKISQMQSLSKIFSALILTENILTTKSIINAWLTFPTRSSLKKFCGCNVCSFNFPENLFPYQLNLLTKILTNNKIIEEILLTDAYRTSINKPFRKFFMKKKKFWFFYRCLIFLNFFSKMVN